MSSFPVEKKVRKIQQLIWLEPQVFAKVLEICAKHDVAPNVAIASIVKSAVDTYQPVKVVEKCPFFDEETVKKKCIYYAKR
ncbi:MAG: hypothetical protein QXU09_03510 [Thermoproteota archaeon]